ncbi:hypothetical protein I33_3943 [Bacillus subtilis subsp. subtilis str. RO-NN-1]|uniref:Uncharacterized protein n=1 Tax=Bacillus subtilis TaxID=1423 RepID=A0AAP1E4Z5_BACIU|nr:hypothetical protein I33_3943 [Bacillus subtilis subsp. subtilis str. RO-NN-1]KIN31375.1 hypothetical protein B4069_3988 [Bacillus subtilis]KIN46457.1 hypothetical protein B4072_3944 [Bacillus subtilis]KIN54758.1 hypothetical protein B4146_4077 [Bacillus subtilis]KZD86663.1 hypothetical protein B4122_4905 [Bacillus subtilis]
MDYAEKEQRTDQISLWAAAVFHRHTQTFRILVCIPSAT